MGGIVIDIWEKSNFFGSIGSQKCTKNAIFTQGGAFKAPPASCRVNPLIGKILKKLLEYMKLKKLVNPSISVRYEFFIQQIK